VSIYLRHRLDCWQDFHPLEWQLASLASPLVEAFHAARPGATDRVHLQRGGGSDPRHNSLPARIGTGFGPPSPRCTTGCDLTRDVTLWRAIARRRAASCPTFFVTGHLVRSLSDPGCFLITCASPAPSRQRVAPKPTGRRRSHAAHCASGWSVS